MGDVKLNSAGGGSVTLTTPSTASNLTVTLPSASGTLATTSGTGSVFTNPTINGFTGDTSVVNIGSGQFYKDTSGNVGIGTSSPGAKLNVVDSSSNDALRITQTGAGNALVVEDSANPDSTPFVVDANGFVVIGNTTAIPCYGFSNQLELLSTGNAYQLNASFRNDAFSNILTLAHSRNGAVGSHTVVQSGDDLGALAFAGSDGTAFIRGAQIAAQVDGTPGTNDMPGRLIFSTTADGASSPTERMRLDSSGNLGIGTASPSYKITLGGQTGGVAAPLAFKFSNDFSSGVTSSGCKIFLYNDGTTGNIYGIGIGANADIQYHSGSTGGSTGNHRWYTNDTERMRLDSSGNLGLGVTPSGWYSTLKAIQVGGTASVSHLNAGTGNQQANYGNNFYYNTSGVETYIQSTGAQRYRQLSGAGHIWEIAPSGTAGNTISFTQAMTLDASGNLLVGTTSQLQPGGVVGVANILNSVNNGAWALALQNNATTASWGRGLGIRNATDFNTTSSEFIYCTGNTNVKFVVMSNGGIYNFSANNVNLSDERVKTAITPAPSWLPKINAIEVVNFKYKDQTHDDFNLGVIAQQVLEVAPEIINEEGFGETPEDGVPLLSIYETDLMYGMLKAIQELSAKNSELESRLAALEGK